MENKSKSLAVGDRVRWSSQANGVWKTKNGLIVEVVPAHKVPRDKNFGSSRNHESYIVEIIFEPQYTNGPKSKITRKKKPERYWPKVQNLRLVRRGSASVAEAAPIESDHEDAAYQQHTEFENPAPAVDPVAQYAQGEEDQAIAGLEKFCDPDALGSEATGISPQEVSN